jgi:CBS domain-containing protein
MKIMDFTQLRGKPVVTVGPDETVASALDKLVKNNIGALPVVNAAGGLAGIVSERDVLNECSRSSKTIDKTPVRNIMTAEVAVGNLRDDLDYAISVMQQKRIRHLPILSDNKLIGMISMRDIIDVQLSEVKAEVRYASLIRAKPTRRVI